MNNYIDLTTATQELSDWIINFLDVPHAMLNNIAPCPFAKTALINNKIKFLIGTDSVVNDMLALNAQWDNEYEGVVLIYPSDIDAENFSNSVEYVNQLFYRHSGLLALEDHPSIPEDIAGLRFNNQKYAVVIVQRAEKLRKASEILNKRGYYKNWKAQDLDNVVNWRW
jgi:hypothetical protein